MKEMGHISRDVLLLEYGGLGMEETPKIYFTFTWLVCYWYPEQLAHGDNSIDKWEHMGQGNLPIVQVPTEALSHITSEAALASHLQLLVKPSTITGSAISMGASFNVQPSASGWTSVYSVNRRNTQAAVEPEIILLVSQYALYHSPFFLKWW
ncbi:hypothetical protein BDQ17DRAFT_1334007 [Cyathus striatus]|nr:hypothetical protein BDQ17DRAFT_1334007 [Cyathus striatus]